MPTADARSQGRHREAGVSSVPSLIRSVTIAAAPRATHACSPQTASQVKTASQPRRSPSAASSANSRAFAYGTTNPNRMRRL